MNQYNHSTSQEQNVTDAKVRPRASHSKRSYKEINDEDHEADESENKDIIARRKSSDIQTFDHWRAMPHT